MNIKMFARAEETQHTWLLFYFILLVIVYGHRHTFNSMSREQLCGIDFSPSTFLWVFEIELKFNKSLVQSEPLSTEPSHQPLFLYKDYPLGCKSEPRALERNGCGAPGHGLNAATLVYMN